MGLIFIVRLVFRRNDAAFPRIAICFTSAVVVVGTLFLYRDLVYNMFDPLELLGIYIIPLMVWMAIGLHMFVWLLVKGLVLIHRMDQRTLEADGDQAEE